MNFYLKFSICINIINSGKLKFEVGGGGRFFFEGEGYFFSLGDFSKEWIKIITLKKIHIGPVIFKIFQFSKTEIHNSPKHISK